MSFPGMTEEQIRQKMLELYLGLPTPRMPPELSRAGQALSDFQTGPIEWPSDQQTIMAPPPNQAINPLGGMGNPFDSFRNPFEGPPVAGLGQGFDLSRLDPSYLLPESRTAGPNNPTPVQEKLFDDVGRGIQGAMDARSAPGRPSASERLGRVGSQIMDPDLFRAGSVAPPTSRMDAIGKGLESGARQVGNFFMNLTPAGVPVRVIGGAMKGLGEARDFLSEEFPRLSYPYEEPYPTGFETGAPKLGQPGFIGPAPVAGQAGAIGPAAAATTGPAPTPGSTGGGGGEGGLRGGMGSATPTPGSTVGGGGEGALRRSAAGLTPVGPAGPPGAAGGPIPTTGGSPFNAEYERYIQEVNPGAHADYLNQQRGRDPNRDFWSGLENRQAKVAGSLFPLMEDRDPTNDASEFSGYIQRNLEGRRQPGGRMDFRGALLSRLGDPAGATDVLAALGVEGQVEPTQIATVARNVGNLVETVQTQGGRFGALARQRGKRAEQAVMALYADSIRNGGTGLSDVELGRVLQQFLQ